MTASSQKKSFFTFKINQNKKRMISIIPIRHRIFDIVSTSRYDALWLYGRYSDVDEAKELMSNFIWLNKIIHAFINKFKNSLK